MDIMKEFVSSAQIYSKSFQEEDIITMESQLEMLSACTDMNVFEPDTVLTTKFYCQLRQLMCSFVAAPRSKIVQNSVSVLQQASQNSAAKLAMVHVHQFSSVLGRLLVAGAATLTVSQRIHLLTLLQVRNQQELTYDTEVTWREALTPGLIHTLVQWICNSTSGEDGYIDIVGPSLGVLVNLCHKNLVAFCVLAHCVDLKELLKMITEISNCNSHLSIQAFKMMRILKVHDVPDSDILSFCESSFKTALDALQHGETFVLRQTVDFCIELFTDNCSRTIILKKYHSLESDMHNLLSYVSQMQQPSSIALCLELLAAVSSMGVKAVQLQYANLVTLALRWVHVHSVSSSALSVLRAVVTEVWPDQQAQSFSDQKGNQEKIIHKYAIDSNDFTVVNSLKESILEQLQTGVAMLVPMLADINYRKLMETIDSQRSFTALLQLFQRLLHASKNLRDQILSSLNPEHVAPLFEIFFSNSKFQDEKPAFKEEVVSLIVEALLLMSYLACHNDSWKEVYLSVVQHKEIQRLLGTALFIAPESVKAQVLYIIHDPYFPEGSLGVLSRSLSDLESVLLHTHKVDLMLHTLNGKQKDIIVLFTPAQEQCLNNIISIMEEALRNGQIANVEAAHVIDIYQCKLAKLSSSEHLLSASLEAAGERITRVQQKLTKAKAKAKKNKKLIYSIQEEMKSLNTEYSNTNKTLVTMQSKAAQLENTLTEEKNSKEVLLELLDHKDNDLQSAEKHLSAVSKELKSAHEQLELKETECKLSLAHLDALRKNSDMLMDELQEKNLENEILQKQNEELSIRNDVQRTQLRQLKEELQNKGKALEDSLREIQKLKEILNSQDAKLKIQNGKLISALFELKMLNNIHQQIHELSSGKQNVTIKDDSHRNSD